MKIPATRRSKAVNNKIVKNLEVKMMTKVIIIATRKTKMIMMMVLKMMTLMMMKMMIKMMTMKMTIKMTIQTNRAMMITKTR